MKKLARKIIHTAAMAGDQAAMELLKHIKRDDLMHRPMIHFNSFEDVTMFKWDDIKVAYYGGRDEQIRVWWNEKSWVYAE